MSESLPPTLKRCSQCDTELSVGGTNGLCPACLMAEAMKPTGPNMTWQPPSAEDLAKLLPQYNINRMLGRGGMGAVYQGTQKSLDRPVAIKILSLEMDDEDRSFAERFKNEARAMAKLSHPGIVAVYDSGETADGMLYIVMEFIEGTDVARMITKDKRLHSEHAMAITAHVCDALAYAHERGIIHRDIKPANIMVGYDGVVKVADFGLAKMSKSGEVGLTQMGMAMGTPFYIAPEALILGTAVDQRADIYAVGVMLYQMLTGKLPQGFFELPSLQVPGLDPRYDGIIGKALRENRDLRYPSVLEMRHDLDAILTQPVVKVDASEEKAPAALKTQARPQRPGGQAAHRPQRVAAPPAHKTSLGGVFVWLAVIALMAVGGLFWMIRTAPPASRPEISAAPPEPVKTTPPPASSTKEVATDPKPAPVPLAAPPTVAATAAPAATPAPAPSSPPMIATPSPSESLPPELAALDAQFLQLRGERVVGPFEADLAKLDSNYLGGITRKIAEEKAAGHLDGILALETEQQRLAAKQTMPEADDEEIPASLKGLRAIYREQIVKLAAQRAANLKALTDPLIVRLVQLEVDFTKADRLPDAKIVRGYRELLAEENVGALATQDVFTNTLGMRFVSVPGTKVLFCIHETRRQDYAAYASSVPGVDGSWRSQSKDGVPMGNKDTHPVVGVSWEDAQRFCAWLTKKEGRTYRLATDLEWSHAAGIGGDETWTAYTTPEMLNGRINGAWPWSGDFPPKTKDNAGNFGDMAWRKKFPTHAFMDGFTDGFATTAPVMSFKPNKLGLYDIGGNVWEWVEDWSNAAQKDRVLRGASFITATRGHLLTSYRGVRPPAFRDIDCGFRCVVETLSSDRTNSVTARPGLTTPSTVIPSARSGFTNTLGMKFVPVTGTNVLFCIHETRRQDYEVYAAEDTGADGSWKEMRRRGIPCGHEDNHPVVGVNWDEAQKFCAWLSKKEGKTYRLPTDQEWSYAVGIGRDEKWTKDTTPESLHQQVQNEFPWGRGFPPKPGDQAGNYGDAAWRQQFPTDYFIEGYSDGFATTAPVMSFKPNRLGLYDLGGSVWEWVEDWWNAEQKDRTLRGASFPDFAAGDLLSSSRPHLAPTIRDVNLGFRLVLVPSKSAPVMVVPPPVSRPPTSTLTSPKSDFTNTLGMMFVKVPGTEIQMCIHETRRQDYTAYAAATPNVNDEWQNQLLDGIPCGNKDDHPVVGVSWADAQAFCVWLTKKEGKTYRLPTDREWSYAVGIGLDEKWTTGTTPEMLNHKVANKFPWGGEFPPKTKDQAGNYGDSALKEKFPAKPFIEGYTDGFPTTAPVMSFKPNKLGLYDLGGNASEWVEDWWNAAKVDRVLRGASWIHSSGVLLSSGRFRNMPGNRGPLDGFRCVVEASTGKAATTPTKQ